MSTACPQDPRKAVTRDPSPAVVEESEFEIIDEVEWADDPGASGELAPRPKSDRSSDPCGCFPDGSSDPCCNDMSCVLYACLEECRSNCEAGSMCRNKRLTRREWKSVEVFDAGVKGRGLRVKENVKRGELITEYVGRAIRKGYLDLLFKRYRTERMLYIMAIDNEVYIDARKRGGIARYINHSCEPNCIVEKWMVKGVTRAGIFAFRDILAGEELSFDYKWDRKRGRAPTKCHCLSLTCRGTLEVAKSMEQDELERRLMGHWRKPTNAKAGREIVNRSIKILSQEHHEYFSADVCKSDETTGQHLVIYREGLEEEWVDLANEDWMILDEEAEQFVIAKKSQPSTVTSSLVVAPSPSGEPTRKLKNYMFVQTPVKEQFIGRHLIERCQRNCHVTIDVAKCERTYETPLPDDEVALEQQRAFEVSKDELVWKLTITGFHVAKAYSILEKNVEFIEKALQATEVAVNGTSHPANETFHGARQEVIIPRCVVDQVKRRFPELRDKCRSVNITFVHSESKSKQFSRLLVEASLASDLEPAKDQVWMTLVAICMEANAPTTLLGIHKDLGFLAGELSSDQFHLLLNERGTLTLHQECSEDLRESPFFSSFEATNRCVVWIQSLEDKGRIDGNNRVVSEAKSNAPRTVYFGCAPKDVPGLWALIQVRAAELARGVRYLYLGVDRAYQQFLMRNGGQFLQYIKKITDVSVSVDHMTGNHLRIDGKTQDAQFLANVPDSESDRVAVAEELIRLQIELYRDHCIRDQFWNFGRDWTLISSFASPSQVDNAPTQAKRPNSSRFSPTSSRSQFELRAIATACIEVADIVATLELSGTVAAHAAIIMYRFVTLISDKKPQLSQLKTRELLLGSLFLANKAQKVAKWKRMDSMLEAAYKTFYPGTVFNRDNEEVSIMVRRVMIAEAEILATLDYDIFWRGADWILTVAVESGEVAKPLAENAFDLCLSGPVLAAGPTLWLKYGAEYVFAAVAGLLAVDLEKLIVVLSLIPFKVSEAVEIIAQSVNSNSAGKKTSFHNLFSGEIEDVQRQILSICDACTTFMQKGHNVIGTGVETAMTESARTHAIIGRRDSRQRIFRSIPLSLMKERIVPVIDGLCAESNCKIFVEAGASLDTGDIILQGSWRAVAIAEHLVLTVCDHSPMLQPAVDGCVERNSSTCIHAKSRPGLMSTNVVNTSDGWNRTIQGKVLQYAPSWGRKVGGKCCVAGNVPEDAVRCSGLRWWIPPRYGPSPSGSICDMLAIRDNKLNGHGGDLESLASLARDFLGTTRSSEQFPSLMAFCKSPCSDSNERDDRHMAVSLQRWPPEKVSNKEQKSDKGGPVGASPAALQEMELLTQLHALVPSPQGHPNFILPVAVCIPPEDADSADSVEKPSQTYATGKGSNDDIFSLFRTSEENEKVARKEKKKRDNLIVGAHIVFHPTPFILQRFTSRSKRSSGSSTDSLLTPPLLTGWFHDLLSALVHCHENHVVLRTLQPDQIVVDHSGVAKLGGLYRATVLPVNERQKSPNALKSALSRKDKSDEGDEASSAYIAPEILLGSAKHTKESDMWSLGCLFAHLLLNKPLFVGKDKPSLLLSIFKVVGAPGDGNYREGQEFPLYSQPKKNNKRGVRRALRVIIGEEEIGKHALVLDLLDRMLHLNPKKRIKAADALKHECMVTYIESCSSDSFRKHYVNDWLALKQKLMKNVDDREESKEATMKRKAFLMSASAAAAADKDGSVEDDLYDMDDLLGDTGDKKQKL